MSFTRTIMEKIGSRCGSQRGADAPLNQIGSQRGCGCTCTCTCKLDQVMGILEKDYDLAESQSIYSFSHQFRLHSGSHFEFSFLFMFLVKPNTFLFSSFSLIFQDAKKSFSIKAHTRPSWVINVTASLKKII